MNQLQHFRGTKQTEFNITHIQIAFIKLKAYFLSSLTYQERWKTTKITPLDFMIISTQFKHAQV